MKPIDASDVTRETSLFQLYRLSYKFPANRFNQLAAGSVFIGLCLYCLLMQDRPSEVLALFRKLAEIGLSFSTSTLGFLIAGFTVFVTVTKLEIFVEMASKPFENSGESFLKYNLSAFVLAFAHYVSYVFVCVIVALFLQPKGLMSVVSAHAYGVSYLSPHLPSVYKVISFLLLVGLGTWTAYLVLLLKSFIYNTYAVVTLVVRWELTRPKGKQ